MFQGNWKCSKCGGAIKELPFEPRSESGLTCRDCYFNSKNGGGQSSGGGDSEAPEPDMGPSVEAPMMDPDEGSIASEPPPPPPDLDGAVPATPGERKMFTGDWKCATCDGPITSLPFEPRDVTNLKCIDCFKKSKA